ncbi:MAG: hypothetical protein ACHQIO_20835, partial [Nevskiales bacterium]
MPKRCFCLPISSGPCTARCDDAVQETGGRMTELSRLVDRPGANEAAYTDPAFPDRPIKLFSARPRHFDAATPVLFSHHGRGRNGRDYRDYWLPLVDEADLLVIAPELSNESFPGQPWYNGGNLLDEAGRLNPRTACTYAIVEHLFAELQARGLTRRRHYGLFGHSAGSQYVHRMISLDYRASVAAAVAANAGTYAMPDLNVAFPYGLGGIGLDVDALRKLLEFRLTIMAGTADNNPNEEFFPRDPRSMQQGASRYERAHRYIRSAREAAERLGTHCAWTIIDV